MEVLGSEARSRYERDQVGWREAVDVEDGMAVTLVLGLCRLDAGVTQVAMEGKRGGSGGL